MSNESNFLIFAIEYYRNRHGLNGAEVTDLFERYDIYKMVTDNYFIYHIESPDHFVQEIDEAICRIRKAYPV
ncbi:MAG: DUF3791 domain-containing protein [Coriobacteriales bacterium]|jgi:hypothetical protein|nr:DUF3791 domain-containing protein [Coriobacteriales bacterium]